MAVEFSEYRCKKKYKPKSRKFPLIRLLIIVIVFVLLFKFDFIQKILDILPLPKENTEISLKTWKEKCEEYGGTPFELKNDLVQCSWIVGDSSEFLPNAFLRYIASIKTKLLQKIHWISNKNNFENAKVLIREDSLIYTYFNVMLSDSSYAFVDALTGCKFPGLCPSLPLDWSNISISEDFDFEGQDRLIAEDEFLGPGEAPVHPILSGVVVNAGRDSLGSFVEINHGNNCSSRISGVLSNVFVGDSVDVNFVLGRLPPKDSARFFLSVRCNGLFIRWADFYKKTHIMSIEQMTKFKEEVGI